MFWGLVDPQALPGSKWDQNDFHTKLLFAFFTVLTFAMKVKKMTEETVNAFN